MPIWSPYQSKPQPGALIDWSRPLAQGLRGFYTLNEGSGPTLYDATGIGPALLAEGYGSGSPWTTGTVGASLNATSATTGAQATVPAALQFSGAATLAASVRVTTGPSNSTPALGFLHDTTTNQRVASIELDNVTAPADAAISWWDGTTTHLLDGRTLAAGDHVISCSFAAGNIASYVDGTADLTSSAGYVPAWSTTSPVQIGALNFFAGRSLGALVYWAAWWSRLLSAQEHAAIGAGPAAIFGEVFGSARTYFLMSKTAAALTLVRRTLYPRAGSRGVA
jgi:hypothetical protein